MPDDLAAALQSEAEKHDTTPTEIVGRILRRELLLDFAVVPPVGVLAEKLLLKGFTNQGVVDQIKALRPDADTSVRCVSFYRTQARKKGLPVPTQLEARATEKAATA